MTNEKQVLPQLTVAQLMQDLSTLPQDAQVFVSILGAGITIPIVGLSKYSSTEGLDLIIFNIPPQNTIKALEIYQENMLKHTEAGEPN